MSVLMDMHQDHVARRMRLGMPTMPKARMAFVRRKRPAPPPVVVARPAVTTPDAVHAPFNFYRGFGPETIIQLMALKHHIKYHDILGTSRSREMMAIRRHTLALVISHCRPMSLSQLGRVFHKNHATIINLLGRRKDRRRPS